MPENMDCLIRGDTGCDDIHSFSSSQNRRVLTFELNPWTALRCRMRQAESAKAYQRKCRGPGGTMKGFKRERVSGRDDARPRGGAAWKKLRGLMTYSRAAI